MAPQGVIRRCQNNTSGYQYDRRIKRPAQGNYNAVAVHHPDRFVRIRVYCQHVLDFTDRLGRGGCVGRKAGQKFCGTAKLCRAVHGVSWLRLSTGLGQRSLLLSDVAGRCHRTGDVHRHSAGLQAERRGCFSNHIPLSHVAQLYCNRHDLALDARSPGRGQSATHLCGG